MYSTTNFFTMAFGINLIINTYTTTLKRPHYLGSFSFAIFTKKS